MIAHGCRLGDRSGLQHGFVDPRLGTAPPRLQEVEALVRRDQGR